MTNSSTLKERLQNRTRKTINALDDLARLSEFGDEITKEQIDRIRAALEAKVNST